MSKMPKIDVSEVTIGAAQQVDVVRHGNSVVILLDGQAFELDAHRATGLAWAICQKVDAIRGDQIQQTIDRQQRSHGQETVTAFAA